MTPAPVALATKDNASGQLNAGISPSALSIVLKAGNGANFPQPYSGSATSLGAAVTLNSTGILAAIGSGSVGKWIWNKTDGSVAVVTAVATNSVTTTRLLGGTTNLWNSADVWCIDPFVATFAVLISGAITTYEEALITARSTDTLTVPTGGRGYNGATANTFSADDYVYLFCTSPILERLKDLIAELAKQQDTDRTSLAAAQTDITNFKTGAYDYVVSTGSLNAYAVATPALAAYAAGNEMEFKASFSNTGAATINVNSLGAKSIKKNDGATALVSGDIVSGQIVRVRYDGTNFQMLSPGGTPAVTKVALAASGVADSTAVGASSTAEANMDVNYSVPASFWAAGSTITLKADLLYTLAAGTLTIRVKLGTTAIGSFVISALDTARDACTDVTIVCRTVSSSGTIYPHAVCVSFGPALQTFTVGTTTLDMTASQTLQLSAQFSSSNAGHSCKVKNFPVYTAAL